MFSFIRKWWRRRSRAYRCDDCGAFIRRSENPAKVTIEPIKLPPESDGLARRLNQVRALRLKSGATKIVLSCPSCVETRLNAQIKSGLIEYKTLSRESLLKAGSAA